MMSFGVGSSMFQMGSVSRRNEVPRDITKEEKQVIFSAFHEADSRHKGLLSREDLKVGMVILFGYKPSKYEVDQLMSGCGDDGMTLETFVEVMSRKTVAKDEDEEIRQTFLAFDSQCRGFLTVRDLQKVFSEVAPHLPAYVVESAFREVDRSSSGRVSFKDFEFMMKYNLDDKL